MQGTIRQHVAVQNAGRMLLRRLRLDCQKKRDTIKRLSAIDKNISALEGQIVHEYLVSPGETSTIIAALVFRLNKILFPEMNTENSSRLLLSLLSDKLDILFRG